MNISWILNADYTDYNRLDGVEDYALKQLEIEKTDVTEIEPIIFHGFVYDNDVLIKKGKDNKYRSSKYKADIFFFSNTEIYCCTLEFSLIDKSQEDYTKVFTEVFSYNKINSVSLEPKETSIKIGKKNDKVTYKYFQLTTTEGTHIDGNARDSDTAQRSFNTMYDLIMNKKNDIT